VDREYAELGARRIGAAERGIKLEEIRAIASFTGASYPLLAKPQR
jgi:hypothetical protein